MYRRFCPSAGILVLTIFLKLWLLHFLTNLSFSSLIRQTYPRGRLISVPAFRVHIASYSVKHPVVVLTVLFCWLFSIILPYFRNKIPRPFAQLYSLFKQTKLKPAGNLQQVLGYISKFISETDLRFRYRFLRLLRSELLHRVVVLLLIFGHEHVNWTARLDNSVTPPFYFTVKNSLLSLLRRLSTRRCPHLLLTAVLGRRCRWAPAPAIDRYLLSTNSAYAAAVDRWDRQTGVRPFHRPRSAYQAHSVNNITLIGYA